jgi:hypothetical protein
MRGVKITIITYQNKFAEHLKKIEKRLPVLLYKYRLRAKMSEYVRQEDSTVLTLRLCPKNINIKNSALSITIKNAHGCRKGVRALQLRADGLKICILNRKDRL